jgi:hypothetical protein
LLLDYYLTEKTMCGGKPALNGFVKMVDGSRPDQAGYSKITVYLDSGEAVYSDNIGETDLVFDTATAHMGDFDFAFWPQTIIARGGKSILADEIWNGTKPVLLRDIAAFGSNGDYSVVPGQFSTAAGLACKNITVSAKTSGMDGQIHTCIHLLEDVNLTFLASANALGGPGFSWEVRGVAREGAAQAYYPQCLSPVSCPVLSKPTQENYSQCSGQGKSIESTRDGKGCVTAYDCISNEERAGRQLRGNQAPNCPPTENLVKDTAACWDKRGNVDYQRNEQTGCIESVVCRTSPG